MWWFWSTFALAQDARCPVVERTEDAAHAETLRRWAAAAGDDLELLCEAQAHSTGAAADRASIRIDNAFDTVRNVYPPTWWLLGDDPVAEPNDGPGDLPDYTVRALENAWHPMARTLDAPARPMTAATVSCEGDASCDGLVDMLEAHVERHLRLQPGPDDATLALAIHVEDHVTVPRTAVRVRIAAVEDGQPLGDSQGVGADHVPWRQLDLLACLGLLATALGGALAGQRLRGDRRGVAGSILRVGVGVLVGAVFGWWAFDWTPMAPVLDDPALTPHGLPALQPVVWAAGLGVALLIAPVVTCILGVLVVGRRLGLEALDRFDLGLLAPGAVAGSLGVALAPVPVGMGPDGLLICAALGIPAIGLATTCGGVIEDVVHAGIGRRAPRRMAAPVALGILGALALPPLALTGELSWLVLATGCALTALVARLGRAERAKAEQGADLGERVAGSLRTPRFVTGAGRDPAALATRMSQAGFHQLVLEGPDGVGKSRLAREVLRSVDAPGLRVGIGEAEMPAGEGRVQPYGVVSAALGQVLGEHLELASLQARDAALNEAAGAASEAALEVLPGVGVLLSLSEGRDAEALTVERLRRDVTRALLDAAARGPVALVMDDIQWADASSLALLAHLQAMLPEEPLAHPVILVLIQRPAEGPHQALSAVDERVQLEPFDADQVGDLLRAAGVNAHEGFAAHVADRVGGRPRHVLELVQELVDSDLVETQDDADGVMVMVPNDLDERALARAVPRQLRELEEQRLARIESPRQLLLLQVAAHCGRTFPTHALAEGLGWSRIDVLLELAELERSVGLIEDLDDDEQFRFRTELTRQVLAESSARDDGGPRKIIREFHRRVVRHLRTLEPPPLAEIVMHALHGGDATRHIAATTAVQAAEVAERTGAVPEASSNIAIARRLQRSLDDASADRLDRVEAQILARGNTDDQRRAVQLFRGLVESDHVDRLEVVNRWFSIAFALRQTQDLDALVREIQDVRRRLDDASQHSLVEAVCDFYDALARAEARGVRPGPDPDLAAELQIQIDRLRALAPERDRDLLLARILQAQASRLADHDAYLAVCEESLALKERHGDIEGQAITMGMLANYFLWWASEPDPALARSWLERDLEQVDRMGDMAARSSILNRIALTWWMEGDAARAVENATQALRRARQATAAIDLLFAAFAVIRYAAALGDVEQVDRTGNTLVQPPEQWPWETAEQLVQGVPAGLLAARAEELDELSDELDRVGAASGWRTRLAALLR